MTSIQNSIPNERSLVRSQWGTEATRGTVVASTYKMYGDLKLRKMKDLVDRPEYAGTFFQDYTPFYGPSSVEGTFEQLLTYEDLPILLRYAMKGGLTGVSDAQSTPGYLYTVRNTAARDDIDTATIEYGVPGMPSRAEMVYFPEFTISADADDTEGDWKWSSRCAARDAKLMDQSITSTATGGSTTTVVKSAAGWTVNAYAGAWVRLTSGTAGNIGQFREIASNDATTLTLVNALPSSVANSDGFTISGVFTSGLTDRTRESIDAAGTLLYLDTTSAIGTTPVNGRFISFSLNHILGAYPKRFMEDVGRNAAKLGRNKIKISGQIRIEFDRRDEYDNWVNETPQKIRITKTGSTIDSGASTTKAATIDIYNANWESPDDSQDRESNLTATFGFRAFVDSSEAVPLQITAKNKLSALP